MLPVKQQIEAIVFSLILFAFIIHSVKKGNLREEYSWLWLTIGCVIIILAVWFDIVKWITRLMGFQTPASTIFVFGLFFLVVINLHSAIKISSLANKQKNLMQELAILRSKLDETDRE